MLFETNQAEVPAAPGGDRPPARTLSPILPDDIERAALALLEAAGERGVSIASAESCTGGLLASVLTDVEGHSSAFDRAFVVYSPRAKCELLGLADEMVENCGCVSEEVARALAESALERSSAGLAVGITGFAGPAGEDDEEGLVHLAVAREERETEHREMHYGAIGRGGVRIEALRTALEMMRAAL